MAAVLIVVFLPLPNSVLATFEIQARDAEPVYVDVPGKLVSIDTLPGQQVKAGAQLAQLRSIDLDLEISKLSMAVRQYTIQIGKSSPARIQRSSRHVRDSLYRRNPQVRPRSNSTRKTPI